MVENNFFITFIPLLDNCKYILEMRQLNLADMKGKNHLFIFRLL